MPTHGRRLPWLGGCALLLALGCGDGCGCGNGAEEGTAAPEREEAAPPEGLVWEASVSGSRSLEAIRDRLPPRLRAVVPSSPGALLERVAPQLPFGERVPEDADLWAVSVEVGDGEHVVMAAPVVVAEGARPLGPDLPVLAGAPHGGSWIGAVPGRDDDAAMLLDEVLLVSGSPRALEEAAPYLAFTLLPRGAEEGVRMRFPEGFVSDTLRRAGDRIVSRQAAQATAAARAERERHDEPPTYGDPEALVAAVRDELREVLAHFPDVGETTVRLGADGAGLRLVVDAEVREGSPLAEALGVSTAGEPFGIGALPTSTALAWATRTERSEEPSFLAATLEAMGGERMGTSGGEALAELDRAFGEARGEGVVVAFGADTEAPWAMVATAPAEGALDRAVVERSLRAAYLRDVVGGVAGCEGAASVRRSGGDATTLCRTGTGEPAVLEAAGAEGAWAVALSRGGATVAGSTATRLGNDGGGEGLASSPDVARALSSLGDRVLLAAVLVPSRLLGAAALFPFEPLERVREDVTAAARPAPIVLGASRSEEGLRIEILATEAALEDLVGVIEPFVAD